MAGDDFIPHYTGHMIAYPWWDWSLIHVSKRGPLECNVSVNSVMTMCLGKLWINSLSPGKFQRNVRWVIFKLILVINGWVISCEIVLRWILLDHSSNGLVPSGQCWPRSMLPYGVTRPQWVNYKIKSVVGKLRNQLQGQIGWHWNTSQSHLCWGQGLWCAHQGCQCLVIQMCRTSFQHSISLRWSSIAVE